MQNEQLHYTTSHHLFMSCRVLLPSASTRSLLRPSTRSALQTAFRAQIPVVVTRNFNISRKMDADMAKAKESMPEKDYWKTRPPYKIHDKGENFKARYEASCHCGKVKYQLSREEPLDSKLCHCTTCQTQHGISYPCTISRREARVLTVW